MHQQGAEQYKTDDSVGLNIKSLDNQSMAQGGDMMVYKNDTLLVIGGKQPTAQWNKTEMLRVEDGTWVADYDAKTPSQTKKYDAQTQMTQTSSDEDSCELDSKLAKKQKEVDERDDEPVPKAKAKEKAAKKVDSSDESDGEPTPKVNSKVKAKAKAANIVSCIQEENGWIHEWGCRCGRGCICSGLNIELPTPRTPPFFSEQLASPPEVMRQNCGAQPKQTTKHPRGGDCNPSETSSERPAASFDEGHWTCAPQLLHTSSRRGSGDSSPSETSEEKQDAHVEDETKRSGSQPHHASERLRNGDSSPSDDSDEDPTF